MSISRSIPRREVATPPPKIQLPLNYVPVDRLVLCSNYLEAVLAPIVASRVFPVLLVGKSENEWPSLWLAAHNDRTGVWNYIIEENRVLVDSVCLAVDKENRTIQVTHSGLFLIRLSFAQPERPEIVYLFLPPVGLNIKGDHDALKIGTNTIARCSFIHVAGAIAVD